MTQETVHIPRKIADWLSVTLFGAILLAPLMIYFFSPSQDYSTTEKRPLAQLPEKLETINDAIKWPRAWDTYWKDHFGLRNWLIHRYHREVEKRFGVTGNLSVSKGKDGWLFYEKTLKENFFPTGRELFSESELHRLCQGLANKKSWLGRRHIHYLAIVPPDKQSIYPEFQSNARTATKTSATRLGQIVAACDTKELLLLDLRPRLIQHKEQGRLFDKSDSHWNALGAHVAYGEIMRQLSRYSPDMPPPLQFDLSQWREFPGGDLAMMLGTEKTLQESRPQLKKEEFKATKVPVPKELLQYLQLPSLKPKMRRNKQAPSSLRVLVFRDSFFNDLEPFFSETFAEVLYIWQFFDAESIIYCNRAILEQLINAYKPDLVIDEVVERNIERLLPAVDQDWSD